MRVEMLDGGAFTSAAGLWREGEEEPERRLRFPVPAYLIETEDERILVVTGLHPGAVTDEEGRYGAGALGLFSFEQERPVADQVDPGTLTRIVLTHLHFDHAGGLSLVSRGAPVYVQRAEWEAGRERAAIERNFLMPRDYEAAEGEVVLLDGDHDLLGDGSVLLLSTPGHTPGHQSVRVGESLVIGADVAHYQSTLEDGRLPVFGDDLARQRRSLERLRGLRDEGLAVRPGHDPETLRPGLVQA
jgi:glyoxylase-like metal-dependent hydrolase (beta-lactamase superfamily II)